jgi:lactoylglutathione lyase
MRPRTSHVQQNAIQCLSLGITDGNWRIANAKAPILRRAMAGKPMRHCVRFPCDILLFVPEKFVMPRTYLQDLYMRYLHTMVRVSNLDASLNFYCDKLGLVEVRRMANEKGRFTLVFLATPDDARRMADGGIESPVIELTHNWDEKDYPSGRNFGHLAYRVGDIYAVCEKLMAAGVTINRPPRDGHMAFVRSPDGISIELLQDGTLPLKEPWASMPNSGSW